MYCGTAGEMNFYGVTKESGEKRKSNFVVPNTVKETGTDAQGNPTYAANDIEVTNAQAYYTRLRSINESYIYDSSFIKLRELSVSYPVYASKWLNVDVNVFARNLIVWSELKGCLLYTSISQLQKLLKQRQESARQAQTSMQQAQESMLQKQ